MIGMKVFQAYAKGHEKVYGDTPYSAQKAFFLANPKARKCSILEGERNGAFFTVVYSNDAHPRSYKDVTKNTVLEDR